jgi:hypothetical protein
MKISPKSELDWKVRPYSFGKSERLRRNTLGVELAEENLEASANREDLFDGPEPILFQQAPRCSA